MTPAQTAHLRRETLVSAGINAVLSIAFALLAFGGQAMVEWRALAWDALPQSFAIVLMATLVPGWLTRRSIRAGRIVGAPVAEGGLLRKLAPRAIILAVVAAGALTLLHFAVLPLGPPRWSFAATLGYKTGYGALLGAGMAWLAVSRAFVVT